MDHHAQIKNKAFPPRLVLGVGDDTQFYWAMRFIAYLVTGVCD